MHKYFAFILVSFLILLMSACASPKSADHIKFEQDKLLHDLYTLKECRVEKTKRLDDGISSVETIAITVIQACSKESKHVMDTNMLDLDEEYRKVFFDKMNGVKTSGVLNIILTYRSEK